MMLSAVCRVVEPDGQLRPDGAAHRVDDHEAAGPVIGRTRREAFL